VKQIIRDYFTYSSSERKGVLKLLFVIAALLLFLGISDLFIPKEKIDFKAFQKDVEAFNALHPGPLAHDEDAQHSLNDPKTERFTFDPNTASENDLARLGLSAKQVRAVLGFRKHGGFKSREEFAKVKAISTELYESLEPYILVPSEKEGKSAFVKENKIIDLNTADSLALVEVDGIGPSYAKRILRFRNSLGGFISKEQLKEVRGMDDKTYSTIISRITIDSTEIQKIDINTCTMEQLSLHPYISYNQARSLVNYRTAHGHYRAVADIKKCDLISEELYRKIAPYLKAE
jgi:competence protein ComEA